MKTIYKNLLVFIALMASGNSFSATIGVGPIKTFGLFADSKIASTITQLELDKINKYQVLDRFDMQEVSDIEAFEICFGKSCLIEFGQELGVDYILSGNIDELGNKIVVTLKLIDVKKGDIIKTQTAEFDNQEAELQRMIGIVLKEMHDMPVDPLLRKQLEFRNEMIVSNNSTRVNNSGPRIGFAYTVGSINEFFSRDIKYGGLEISPFVSNIGWQFEGQYVGTENFSALFECLINFTALEQTKFLPSVSLLNGFRFGRKGWEFAFGPSFGLSKSSVGFFSDKDKNLFGEDTERYWTENEFNKTTFAAENPLYTYGYELNRNLDSRGRLDISTRWIVALGRTFQSGALNIPVNLYYSSQKGGGMAGISVGFNVARRKSSAN